MGKKVELVHQEDYNIVVQIFGLKSRILKPFCVLEKEIESSLLKNRIQLRERDILVISSKVVSLAEGGLVDLGKIQPGSRAKHLAKFHYIQNPALVELILNEADKIFAPSNGKRGLLTTLKNNILIPSAGIDLSNAPRGFAIVWPKNSWKTAEILAKKLRAAWRLRRLGIILADSRCAPLRWGTTGLALSWAGIEGIEDCRTKKDIYGKRLKVTKKAVADNLASAALLVMGEAGEKIPFTVIRNAPVKFSNSNQEQNKTVIKPGACVFCGIYSEEFLNT